MNSSTKKFVAGFAGFAIALSLVLGAAAPAQAATVAELQAMIATLQAQLSGAPAAPAATASYTFARNLTVGSTGTDVKNLQTLLNWNAATRVALSGAGSKGYETSTFGPATKAAVIKYQRANNIPTTGYVGSLTRAALALVSATPGVPATPANPGTTPVVVTPVTTTGPITAALSNDNPYSGYVIDSQATADFLHVTFTGTGVVNSITLKRTGISDQNTLSNVYLFDGVNRLTDGYSFNSTGDIVINNLNIAVNGSKTIAVKADASSTASNNSTLAISLTSFTSGTSVNNVNLMGNRMDLASGASLATATFSANTATVATVNAGITAYTFWSAPIQINTRTMHLKAANFRMVGSAPSDALTNIKLYVDGVDTGRVASIVATNGSNYASFDLNASPLPLATGSHTVSVRANVEKGSNRNVTFSIQQASDLVIMDPQVGVNVAVGGTIPNTAGMITINTGSATLVIDPVFQQSTTITGGASNVAIGKFKVRAYGEDVKVQSLSVTPSLSSATPTASGLDQVTLYFNGLQVGTQQDWTSGPLTFQLGSQMIVPAGMDSYIEVRSNIQTSASVNYSAGSLAVAINVGSSNGQGQNSQNSLNFPTATVTGNTLTVQTGLLSVSKNAGYASQNANPNTSGVKIGSYTLQNQSTSEGVRVTSMIVALTGSTAITNLAALRTSETSGSGADPVQPQTSNTFSVDFTLAAGATKTIDVLADTSTETGVTAITSLVVTSIGATSNVSSTSVAVTGQTITLATGTVTNPPTLLTSGSTVSQYIAAAGIAGASNATKAQFNIAATGGAATISELDFTVNAPTATSTVTGITVAGMFAPVTLTSGTSTAHITGLNLVVPNGSSGLTQDVWVSYAQVGTDGVTSGQTSQISLEYIKYASGGVTRTLGTAAQCTIRGVTCTATTTGAIAAPTMTMVGSKPSVVLGLPNGASGSSVTGLTAGTKYVADVTVTANTKGDIKVNTIPMTFTGTSGTTFSTSTISVKDGTGTAISNFVLGTTTGFGTATVTALLTFTSGLQIQAGTSQVFRIEIGITPPSGVGNSVATSLTSPATFVWTDTAGGGTASAGTGTLITSFPTSSVSLTN